MKKIISLLSVFAMIATMFTTVAFADENKKFYIEETVDGTNVTITLLIKSDVVINAASGTLDLVNAIPACDSITSAQKNASTYNVDVSKSVITWNYSDTTGFTGVLELGTVTFVNVKSDFILPQKRAFKAVSGSTNITTQFSNEQVGYEVKAPATEPDPEPADPNRTAVTSTFTATTTTYVEVELVGKATNSYALPSGVKGNGLVAGILKYTVGEAGKNGVAPVAGDTFNVNVKNLGSSDFTTILTEKVQ